MKPKLILLSAAIVLSIAGCKKETLGPETTSPPPPTEETASFTDDNAEQYMVAIYGNDTVVLQDTRRMTTTLAKDSWPGLFGYGAYSATFFSPERSNYKFKLTFRKAISNMSSSVSPTVDCALINDICNRDTFTMVGSAKYGVMLECELAGAEYATYAYDQTTGGAKAPVFVVTDRQLISTANGCSTYRIRGKITCIAKYLGCLNRPDLVTITVFSSCTVSLPD